MKQDQALAIVLELASQQVSAPKGEKNHKQKSDEKKTALEVVQQMLDDMKWVF